MIDLTTEHLLPIRDVPRRLPRRPGGKLVHISAVYRWIQRGVRGVRLEAIRVGGTTYTSLEALQRFAEGQTANRSPSDMPPPHTTATRRKQIERAEREVQAFLRTTHQPRVDG